jgi:hypothetical protein
MAAPPGGAAVGAWARRRVVCYGPITLGGRWTSPSGIVSAGGPVVTHAVPGTSSDLAR